MQNYGLMAIHYLHIFFGATLIGSIMFMNFVYVPILLKRPSAESRAFFESSLKPIRILMGLSGGMTFLLGILHGTIFGQVNCWQALTTPYGITFLAAAVITLFMLIHGPRTGPTLLKNMYDGKKFCPDAAKSATWTIRFPLVMLVLILACMVLMHFGL